MKKKKYLFRRGGLTYFTHASSKREARKNFLDMGFQVPTYMVQKINTNL